MNLLLHIELRSKPRARQDRKEGRLLRAFVGDWRIPFFIRCELAHRSVRMCTERSSCKELRDLFFSSAQRARHAEKTHALICVRVYVFASLPACIQPRCMAGESVPGERYVSPRASSCKYAIDKCLHVYTYMPICTAKRRYACGDIQWRRHAREFLVLSIYQTPLAMAKSRETIAHCIHV